MRNEEPLRPPLSAKWIYALGQMGWSLINYMVGSLLTYFYMPPESASTKSSFPLFIPSVTFLGLTLLGIISSGGRLFDAFIDPFIANLSDKSTARIGKRRYFMALSALPLAVLCYMIFSPPTEGVSGLNTIWLGITIFLYYVFFAMYCIPYTALISELGHFPADRLTISTLISVTWALGFLLGNSTPAIQTLFENQGISSVTAFRNTILILSVVGFILMMIPVVFLKEKKYAVQGASHDNFLKSLGSVLQNQPFRYFAASYLLYWLALTFIQMGIIFYITLIFGLDKSMASLFGIVSFFSSFAFYPLMGYFERRFSKKNTILTAFLVFSGIFCLALAPIPSVLRFWLISILSAFPLAVFGILPNTIVADIVHQNERVTGKNQAGMFYAGQAFMMKLGVSLANLIFPSLLIFGKSTENNTGVQMTIGAAIFFCLAGYFVFKRYDEKKVIMMNNE
jgi:Na+/melibiose symporter-like transporter